MPVSNFRSFMGIAKEPTPGTPVPPTDAIAIATDPKPVDTLTLIEDRGWRGSAVTSYDRVAAQRHAAISLDGNVEASTIGYMLQSLLPDLVVTGAAAPFTNAFAVGNTGTGQPGGYTLTDFDGFEARAYSAAKFTELVLGFTADGLLTFKSKANAWASTVVASPAVPSFDAKPPMTSWQGAVTIAGAAAGYVLDGEVSIKRPVDVLQTVAGIQDPYRLWSGPVTVTGKLNTVREDDAEFNRYLQNTKPGLDILFTQDANTSLQLHMSKCAYVTGGIVRGKAYGQMDVTFEGLGNIADAGASLGYSPIKATLKNAKATGTYA